MPDRTLVDIYLDRLASALPLPETERAAVVEEIAAYLTDATTDLVERGVPQEAAQRQALQRLGTPERLAGDLAASHRQPRHLLQAAGTAVAVTLGTAFRSFVIAWALILLAALIFGLALAAVRKVVGPQLLAMDWSPLLDGLLPALVAAITAYAIGRAVVRPVSLAARRPPQQVRPVALVVGGVLMTLIGLTVIEARWTPPTALLMAALPVWFALGVLRPDLVPRWFPGTRMTAIAVLGLLVVGLGALLALGISVHTSGGGVESAAQDPNLEYAHIGPFVSLEHPPIALDVDGSPAGSFEGPGPISFERRGTISSSTALDGWTDLRLEVWQGPPGESNGPEPNRPMIDQTATQPLATAPLVVDGLRVSGEVTFGPLIDRTVYSLALTGLDANGKRWQLAWPSTEIWRWRGTPLQLMLAALR
ncbi:MAG: permease prefix domain 1-containing protein [Candidatus Dormibacteraeota bacterium]|nr:permease prefix domain 1-containing protein [Candidatus Dormibacteraeota bacterium]